MEMEKEKEEEKELEVDTHIIKMKSDMEKRRESLKRVKRKKEKKEQDDGSKIELVRADFSDPEGILSRLALGKKMLRKKKREHIIDSTLDSAHQYACDWEDKELNLPEWFVEDEKKHWFKSAPVTKEEV